MGEPANGFSSETMPLPLPRAFGRLLLLKLLARGGMGDIYLAATTGIEGAERPVVVKTVRRDHIHDGSFLARFLDEARVQSQLNHPGVAQVVEATVDEGGEPYTVVEYVEGRSLSEMRQRAIALGLRLEWPVAVSIALEMAQALAHVHERQGPDGSPLGIVHRDLSPQNVMIGYAGEVKLIDFGTARGHNRRCHTVAGVVFAKPGYVAPEVARQQVGDGRIDLYALGVMLWEMCAGRRLLVGDPQRHLENAAAGKVIAPPIAAAVGAPPLLDALIQKLTANDPDDRYPRASLLVPDLAKLLTAAPPAPNGERGVRARLAHWMRCLWPQEPARSRAEFARLLREAREMRPEVSTPPMPTVMREVAARMAPEDPSVLAGTPYRLLRKIGEGASGTVHEAEHVELGRRVAIKVLAPEHAAAANAIERFRREARAIASLSHPNLVSLYDFGKSLDGRVFLAMELLEGETLDRYLKREGALAWQEAARFGVEVCRALEAAHGASLVHRDLKPQNLFVTRDGGIKLLDFGVAMALADTTLDETAKRQKGFAIFGTPEYMAPEQVAGELVDARCDLYSLGCVIYEMVTGERVFEGRSGVEIMGKQLREIPEPMRARLPGRKIPQELDAIVLRALEKRPEDRFLHATAMREALEALLDAPSRRRRRVRRIATAVLSGAVLLTMAGVAARWTAAADDTAIASAGASPTPASSAPVQAAAPTAAATVVKPTSPALLEARNHARANMTDPRALKAWAWAAFKAADYVEARYAADAWSLRDGTVEPRLFLARVLDASGRRADAKAVLEEWLQLHPDAEEASRQLARLNGEPPKSQIARK